MKFLQYLIFTVFLLMNFSEILAQEIKHTKQCFTTADFVDTESQKIIKTEPFMRVCVNLISEKKAVVWINKKEYVLTFSKNELLETDENGNFFYRGTGLIEEIKFEILYFVTPELNLRVALILIHDFPIDQNKKKFILQYKSRN